jgi:hypothetical protein
MQNDLEKEKTLKTNALDYVIRMRLMQPGDNGKLCLIIFYLYKLI